MRFIGCKENLLPFIDKFIKDRELRGDVFCDLFAGTASVGKHFKKEGYKILSTDILFFSYIIQKVYIEQNKYPQFSKLLKQLKIEPATETLFTTESQNAREVIHFLNALGATKGYIYKNFSPEGTSSSENKRMYFTGKNAQKIDSIRDQIEAWKEKKLLDENEYYFLLCSLIEAVPFVANISGTYAAFLKKWDPRALKDILLEVPEIIASSEKHIVKNIDAVKFLEEVKGVDILYLDPPYNERQYAPNYHILESIARWDKPRVKGITGMRPYEDQKSDFCHPVRGIKALERILKTGNYKHLILSYNDEGIMPEKELLKLFSKFGKVEVVEQNYQRYKSHSNGNGKNGVTEKLYYLKKTNPSNKLNSLSGAEWVYFLNSVEVTNYSTKGADGFAHHLRKLHPSPKPPQLMKKFIDFFTQDGQTVLDPFVGVGGTLVAASLSGRRGIGIDLSRDFITQYKRVSKELGLKEQETIVGDALDIQRLLPKDTIVDFILTDPPYGEMLSKKRTGQKNKIVEKGASTPFTKSKRDLGNMDRGEFLEALKKIIEDSVTFLKPKGYLAVFAKDFQPDGKNSNMLHSQITEKLLEIPDLTFRGYKIWYDKTQKLYPFGYPHAFVANQFHQYVLIFRKG